MKNKSKRRKRSSRKAPKVKRKLEDMKKSFHLFRISRSLNPMKWTIARPVGLSCSMKPQGDAFIFLVNKVKLKSLRWKLWPTRFSTKLKPNLGSRSLYSRREQYDIILGIYDWVCNEVASEWYFWWRRHYFQPFYLALRLLKNWGQISQH